MSRPVALLLMHGTSSRAETARFKKGRDWVLFGIGDRGPQRSPQSPSRRIKLKQFRTWENNGEKVTPENHLGFWYDGRVEKCTIKTVGGKKREEV